MIRTGFTAFVEPCVFAGQMQPGSQPLRSPSTASPRGCHAPGFSGDFSRGSSTPAALVEVGSLTSRPSQLPKDKQ